MLWVKPDWKKGKWFEIIGWKDWKNWKRSTKILKDHNTDGIEMQKGLEKITNKQKGSERI